METDGGPLHCRALILAPGTRHRPLGLEGEEALTGQGVSYCAVCDGPFYQGRDTAIVGAGTPPCRRPCSFPACAAG